jgi:hypothetical protein
MRWGLTRWSMARALARQPPAAAVTRETASHDRIAPDLSRRGGRTTPRSPVRLASKHSPFQAITLWLTECRLSPFTSNVCAPVHLAARGPSPERQGQHLCGHCGYPPLRASPHRVEHSTGEDHRLEPPTAGRHDAPDRGLLDRYPRVPARCGARGGPAEKEITCPIHGERS